MAPGQGPYGDVDLVINMQGFYDVELVTGEIRKLNIVRVIQNPHAIPLYYELSGGRLYLCLNVISVKKL